MVGRVRKGGPTLRVVTNDAPASAPAAAPARVTPTLDDAEILAACRRGDASAARALHTRVRPVVDRAIARLLGRKDSRFEDLAQIAMIEIVQSLARFRGECSLDTWSSRVTAHAVFKELRRRRVEHRVFADAVEPSYDDPPSSHDESRAAEARSSLRRVRAHLAEIDPVKSWTIVLHDVCGYDLKEIAEITGASVAAAQSRLVRGRAELQARIEADAELRDLLLSEGRR